MLLPQPGINNFFLNCHPATAHSPILQGVGTVKKKGKGGRVGRFRLKIHLASKLELNAKPELFPISFGALSAESN